MGLIDENDLKDYEKFNSNYEKYNNKQARFNTKIASETRHNGEVVDVLGFIKGKDIYDDRYIVRFNEGTINNNIMTNELEFDFIRNSVQEDMRRELSKITQRRGRCPAAFPIPTTYSCFSGWSFFLPFFSCFSRFMQLFFSISFHLPRFSILFCGNFSGLCSYFPGKGVARPKSLC